MSTYVWIFRAHLYEVVCLHDKYIAQGLQVFIQLIQELTLELGQRSKRIKGQSAVLYQTFDQPHLETFDDSSVFIHVTDKNHGTYSKMGGVKKLVLAVSKSHYF